MNIALSIIVPVYKEAGHIVATLTQLQPLRQRGAEVIVVDGGSSDGTWDLAAPLADHMLRAEKGRANQMNAGAAHARGDILLFLHADTLLPDQADHLICHSLYPHMDYHWGRFDVRISGEPRMLKTVAYMINWRSRMFSIATGDQAIFVRRELFFRIGGFPRQALMEDIDLCQRLKQHSHPLCLRDTVTTSGRRWETRGVWRTIFLMWRLRFKYWLGASADQIAKEYR